LEDPFASTRVTVRDLLAHRSGLGSHNMVTFGVDANASWLLTRLGSLEPAAELRDRAAYSSLGYVVAGELMARVDESGWREVVATRVLRPLGMTATTVGVPGRTDDPPACPHLLQGGQATRVQPFESPLLAPASGLWSTGTDLAKWLDHLLKVASSQDPSIADAAVLRETMTPQAIVRRDRGPLLAYGMGWKVLQHGEGRITVHDGGAVGFTGQIRVDPEARFGVAVVANASLTPLPDVVAERATELVLGLPANVDLLQRAQHMMQRLEQMHTAQEASLRASAVPGNEPAPDDANLIGCYRNDVFGELELVRDGVELTAIFHGLHLQVEHLAGARYLLSHPYTGEMVVTFHLDGHNQVESLSVALDTPPVERRFVNDATPVPPPAK
jgi:CubicO group peptidase (beta-lactamase class C family)